MKTLLYDITINNQRCNSQLVIQDNERTAMFTITCDLPKYHEGRHYHAEQGISLTWDSDITD